jgi:hypothetical protein
LAEKEASEEVDSAVKVLEAADSTEVDSVDVALVEKVSVATAALAVKALEDLTGVDLVARAVNLALISDVSLEDFWVDFNCFVIEKI